MSLNGGFPRRTEYLTQHGVSADRTVHAGLVHGHRVVQVGSTEAGQVIADTDGLITTEPNLGLAMTAADCLLAYFYAPEAQAIGLVHAGRRGLAAGILIKTIRLFRTLGISPGRLEVLIGPSICARHYPVSPPDAEAFSKWSDACRPRAEDVLLDLRRVAWHQLHSSGVNERSITFDPRCTYEEGGLYSYRRDHPAESQLQVGYIMNRS